MQLKNFLAKAFDFDLAVKNNPEVVETYFFFFEPQISSFFNIRTFFGLFWGARGI